VEEQDMLLTQMLDLAKISVKEIGERASELEGRSDFVGLEGTILAEVLRLGASWMGLILTLWASNLAQKAGTRLPCACGGKARWVESRAKTILALVGRVTYGRVYYHCKACREGKALGDEAFGLEHTQTSVGIRLLAAYIAAQIVGFAATARTICRAYHWPGNWLSGKQVQRLAGPLGKALGEDEAARVGQWWEAVSKGLAASLVGPARRALDIVQRARDTERSERMYAQMDGTTARVRGKDGKGSDYRREVKVGAIFWAETGRHASQLVKLAAKVAEAKGEAVRTWVDRVAGKITYVAGLLSPDEFAVRLYAEAVSRGLEKAKEIVILGDGARWIWRVAQEYFPGAVQILDYWHASEWVWKVAHAVWGDGSAKSKEWAEAMIEKHLAMGNAVGLIEAISKLPKVLPPEGQSKSIPEQAIHLFQENAERMHYPEYRARGMEIGSGAVESAGRRVVGLRCKGPGMRWSEEGLTEIINLRTRVLNDRYDADLADLRKAS